MSRLPVLTRPRAEDYPNAPDWFKRFIGTITTYFETVYYALSGALTFGENISAEYREFTQKASDFPVTFQKGKKQAIRGIVLMQVYASGDPTKPLTISPVLNWADTNGGTKIVLTGLLANIKYFLRVLVIY